MSLITGECTLGQLIVEEREATYTIAVSFISLAAWHCNSFRAGVELYKREHEQSHSGANTVELGDILRNWAALPQHGPPNSANPRRNEHRVALVWGDDIAGDILDHRQRHDFLGERSPKSADGGACSFMAIANHPSHGL